MSKFCPNKVSIVKLKYKTIVGMETNEDAKRSAQQQQQQQNGEFFVCFELFSLGQ